MCYFVSCTFLEARINPHGDFQIWEHLRVDFKTKKAWGARFSEEARWRDNASQFYHTFFQPQLVYSQKNFEIAPGYRQEYTKDDIWIVSYAPMIDATFLRKRTWSFENRNRLLFYIPKQPPFFWVYRNRLRFTSPELFSFLKPQFFVDDELFFHKMLGFNQNRFSIGLITTFDSMVKCSIFYMYRLLKEEESLWTDQNVLSFLFGFNF